MKTLSAGNPAPRRPGKPALVRDGSKIIVVTGGTDNEIEAVSMLLAIAIKAQRLTEQGRSILN